MVDLDLLGFNKERSFNLDNTIKEAEKNGTRDVTKYYWNSIKNTWLLPPSIVENDKIALKYYPDSKYVRICFGRNEIIRTNAEKISKNFARGDFGVIVLTGGSFLFLPGQISNSYLMYASVYGVAKYDNKWMGSRIICE